MLSVVFSGMIFFSGSASAAKYVSGTITTNTTWTVGNSPYILVDDLIVDNGTILTIDPGVTVKFAGVYSLIVNGTLNATGTASKPIIFTSNQSSPQEGDWNRIRLHGMNNTLDFCEISYGHYPLYIMGDNTNNTITNCRIHNNSGDGIYVKRSTRNTIFNTTVSNSQSNGITLLESQYNVINKSFVKDNAAFGIYLRSSNNNTIKDTNITGNVGGGIEMGLSSDNITIEGVSVFKNSDTGIDLNGNGFNIIATSYIHDNDGPGIDLGGSSFDNLIEDCEVYDNIGSGIELDDSNLVYIKNSNVYRNQGEAGIYSDSEVENVTIINSEILNNFEDGIELFGGYYVNIIDSNISANLYDGICFNGSRMQEKCLIHNSIISNNGFNGIKLYATSSYKDISIQYNNISSNKIMLNKENGIYFRSYTPEYNYRIPLVQFNNIFDNTIHLNNYGIFLENSIEDSKYYNWKSGIQYNNLFNNTIYDNSYSGIFFRSYSEDEGSNIMYNNFENNTIYSNNYNGIELYCYNKYHDNIYISNNVLKNNTIFLNKINGIYFHTEISYSDNSNVQYNLIQNNTIFLNWENGIYIYCMGDDDGSFEYNKVISNRIYSNSKNGIYIHCYARRRLSVRYNTILSNYIYKNQNDGINFLINANIYRISNPTYYAGYFEYNKIISNYISSNDNRGISLKYRSRNGFFYCQYNEISSNTITKHVNGSGIHSELDNCNVSTWKKSIIINNTLNFNNQGISFLNIRSHVGNLNNISGNSNHGIVLESSTDNIFGYNKIKYNSVSGVELTAESKYNKVRNNNFTSNKQAAVAVNYKSNNNIVSRNVILDHPVLGINISGATNNYLHHNNFINNTKNAYDSTTQLNDWDDSVQGNWWDDYKGFDSNSDGIGDIPYDVPGGGSKDWYPIIKPANIIAPIVENPVPSNGATGVSVTPKISISFSNKMNKSATEAAISMSSGSGAISLTNFSWSNGDMTVTFEPANSLSSTTKYTVIVSIDANDVLENYLSKPYQISFTTEDTIPPKITLTSPYHGSTEVKMDSEIIVTFNEPMNISSISYLCSPDPGGWSVLWNFENSEATFSHTNFSSLTSYTFRITGAQDVAGNYLTFWWYIPNPWTFTTKDVIGPEITTTTPSNGTTGVLLNTDIVVTFSEQMNTTTVTFSCKPDPGGWVTYWSNNDRTVTYSHNDFIGQTIYTFQITAGRDTTGNSLNPSIKNPWSFKTRDTTPPTITATSPKNQAHSIATNAEIKVTFSEAMENTSVSYVCNPNPGSWSAVWNKANTEVTFTHNLFNQNTNYTFQITGGRDLEGNNLITGSVPNPWWFTTLDFEAPKIISAMPINGSIDVELDVKIIVKFSERMNSVTVGYTCTPNPGGWSEDWNSDNSKVTYSHDSFNSSTNYTFKITSGKDLSGNSLVTGNIPHIWTFSTKDAKAPKIISLSPSDNSVEVDLNANVVVTFDESMDRSTVTFTCAPNPSGWTVSWKNKDTVATFMHDSFERYKTYTFQITSGKDLAGNTLGVSSMPNPWSFITEQNRPPIILSDPIITASEEVEYLYDVEAYDANNDDLIYTLSAQPSGLVINNSTGQISWTPTNAQIGSNLVTILVSDGYGGSDSQSFNITVFNVNDLPEIVSEPVTSAIEDKLYSYQLVVSEIDIIDSITYSFQVAPDGMTIDGSTGLITWQPTNDQVGINSIIVRVEDGSGGSDSQAFEILVSNTNDKPVFISIPVTSATEDVKYYHDVESLDVDVDDLVSYKFTTNPAGMSIDSSTGIITWQPNNDHVGINFVSISITDNSGSTNTQSFNITVKNVNDVPVITSEPKLECVEDDLYMYETSASDPDPTNDPLTFSLKTKPMGMEIDTITGLITWRPTNDQVGLNDVIVHVSDGNGGETSQIFKISIINSNDIPIISSEPVYGAVEEREYKYGVVASDEDVGDVLTYQLDQYPYGMVIDSTSGVIIWIPGNDQVGENWVKIEVTDRIGETAFQSFSINVVNINNEPIISSKPVKSATQDTVYVYDVDAMDIDPTNDVLTFSLIDNPNGMVINEETGRITWTPTREQVGQHEVTILVTDGNNGMDEQSFMINVYQSGTIEKEASQNKTEQSDIFTISLFIIILVAVLVILLSLYFRKELPKRKSKDK